MPQCPEPENYKDVVVWARRQREERRLLRARLMAGGAAFMAACLLVLLLTPRSSVLPLQLERAEIGDTGFIEGVDASVLVTIGVPMPTTPLPNWKKPPCSKKQQELNGACWLELKVEPGDDRCGETYEKDGRCYAPVAKPQGSPLSIER
jgi:hypothetical protein